MPRRPVEMTDDQKALCRLLEWWPEVTFETDSWLHDWAKSSFDVENPAWMAWAMISAKLGDPALQDPLLLAAAWLLAQRPFTAEQILSDTGESVTDLFPGTKDLDLSQITERHTLALACFKHSNHKLAKKAVSNLGAFKAIRGKPPSPRTCAVAVALEREIQGWLDEAYRNPELRREAEERLRTLPPEQYLNSSLSRQVPPQAVPAEIEPNKDLPPASAAGPATAPRAQTSASPGAARRKRRWLLGAGVGLIATVAAVLLVVTNLNPGAARATDVSHLLDAENATPAPDWRNDNFWVPASAPLSTLPVIQSGCLNSGSDTEVAAAQAWLKKYGVPQYEPTVVTLRNVSTSSDLLTLDQVIAHGRSTPAKQPGFVFTCPAGGGGPSQWEELNLTLTNGSTATLAGPPRGDPAIFLNQLEKGDNLGLAITYSGNEDFTGTVTVRIRQDTNAGTMPLPAGSGSNKRTVHWHGIPPSKRLEVMPGQTGHGEFSCIPPGGSQSSPEDCTVPQIESMLRNLWGAGATS